MSGDAKDQSSCVIQNCLQFMQKLACDARIKGITIVKREMTVAKTTECSMVGDSNSTSLRNLLRVKTQVLQTADTCCAILRSESTIRP